MNEIELVEIVDGLSRRADAEPDVVHLRCVDASAREVELANGELQRRGVERAYVLRDADILFDGHPLGLGPSCR